MRSHQLVAALAAPGNSWHSYKIQMHFDRFLTLWFFRPLHALATHSAPKPFPILMYHSISEDCENGISPYLRICTNPARFAEQMMWLFEMGFQGLTISAALNNMMPKHGACCKAVAITFDDGFRDFYSHGFPILQQYGFSATVYLPTAFIGEKSRQFKGRECLTWSEIRELNRSGIEFGSHTVNHYRLVHVGRTETEMELRRSKTTIESQIKEPVSTFSYPYAFPQSDRQFINRLRQLLYNTGYESCVTTRIGRVKPNADPLSLPRIPVNSTDDLALFQAKISGAYDWLAVPQMIVKDIKLFLSKCGRAEFIHTS